MSQSDLILFSVDNDGTCRAGLPPAAFLDDYNTRALKMGNLSNPSHAVFSPEGKLYVVKGSEIYMGDMPTSSSKNWFEANAKRLGKTDWERFKHLFFHPNGTLYAVAHDGAFYKGPPPTNENVAWLFTKATKIGSSGWDTFHALFFDPQGILYAVTNDKFVKSSPPTSPDEEWMAASQTIGKGSGWSELSHWMSFSPDGRLWCASKSEGKMLTASPPTSEDDEWLQRAEKLGQGYFYKCMAFTRDRTIKKIVTFDFQPDAGKILSKMPEVVAQQVYDNRNSTSPLSCVFTFNKTVASESTFSHEHGCTIGVDTELSFQAGVPCIAEGEVKISINASTTNNWIFTKVNRTETQYSMSQTFQVAPGKAVRQKAVAQKAEIKIPYTAKVLTIFDYETTVEGTWDGCTYFNLSVVQEDL